MTDGQAERLIVALERIAAVAERAHGHTIQWHNFPGSQPPDPQQIAMMDQNVTWFHTT